MPWYSKCLLKYSFRKVRLSHANVAESRNQDGKCHTWAIGEGFSSLQLWRRERWASFRHAKVQITIRIKEAPRNLREDASCNLRVYNDVYLIVGLPVAVESCHISACIFCRVQWTNVVQASSRHFLHPVIWRELTVPTPNHRYHPRFPHIGTAHPTSLPPPTYHHVPSQHNFRSSACFVRIDFLLAPVVVLHLVASSSPPAPSRHRICHQNESARPL